MKNKRQLLILIMLVCLLPAHSQQTNEELQSLSNVYGFISKHVKLTGYGQFGYSYTDLKNENVRKADNQFYGRLAMFILSGDITKELSWMLQYEAFTSQLLELYAYYKPYTFFQIKAGQMKTCFTFENQLSPSTYESVNFSRVIERLAGFNGDICGNQGGRDIGIQLGGKLIKTSFNEYLLEYRAGIFNGSGLSMKDNNDAKDFAAWVALQPLKELKLGFSCYYGKLNQTFTIPDAEIPGTTYVANINRNREAISACFENKRLTIRSEYLWGKDGNIHREGFYALGHWFVVPSRLAILGKIEGYQADKDNPNYEMIYTIGSSYHIAPKTRLMLNYAYYNYEIGTSVNEIWAQLQIGF